MKQIPRELLVHKSYPIFKRSKRNDISVIINYKEAFSIQSNQFGEGDGFKVRHFKSRAKVLNILNDKTITEQEFKEGSARLINSYLLPLKLLFDSGMKRLGNGEAVKKKIKQSEKQVALDYYASDYM